MPTEESPCAMTPPPPTSSSPTKTFLSSETSLSLPCLAVDDQPSSGDADGDGVEPSQFSPAPIVMSRGNSSGSLSTTEETNGLFCGNRKSQHHDHDSVTPTRNSSPGAGNPQQQQQQQQDKLVLHANHQKRLSSRRLSEDIGGSSHNGDLSIEGSDENATSRSLASVALSPITGAWGWIQKQKERRRQQYLKQLAEEQLQILKKAQQSDPHLMVVTVDSSLRDDSVNNDACNAQQYYDDDDISWVPPVRCVEEQANTDGSSTPRSFRRGDSSISTDPTKPVPFLLDAEQMHDIARYVLPKGIAFCQWKRLYSLTRDGDSFFQCLRLCGSEPKTLLVLKTTRGAIFGGYADSEWDVQSHQNGSFHGSAQACLFSFAIPPDKPTDNHVGDSQRRQPKSNTNIRIFPWTGANRYIQYTDKSENHRMLAFGGGGQEGAFGLCVEHDFQLGSTGPCDTFGNVPLCDQENFNILDLEIWGFLTGQF